MKFLKVLYVLGLSFMLLACGGGGGSPGTTTGSTSSSSSGSGSSGTSTAAPSMTLVLTNGSGTTLTTNAITSGSLFYAKATLLDAAGAAVPNALVTFSTDSTIGTLVSTTVLTDATGVARVQISPASISVVNAATLTAQAAVNGQALSASLAYQTTAASIAIGTVTPTAASITALQSSAVSANVTVNGVAASAGQVAVSFSATCGSFSPASVTTSGSGVATSTYQSLASCSGNVTLSATSGSAVASGSIAVAAAQPANILYNSATVSSLVVSSATSGQKQSTVKFKVVDASGQAMANQNVTFTLDAQSTGAGVAFSVGGATTTSAQTVATDASGIAAVIIQSGTLPTPVVVSAALSVSMYASSSGIVVTSGKASQNNTSLSASKLSIEGLNVDGVTTDLTMRVADRQGNPVPTGTAVTFVASHGLVQGSCLTNASSACTVTYTSQGLRPTDGLVSILAYLDGEESFVDQNGNNVWDSGETFYDMGTAFLDVNRNGASDSGEQTYPGGLTGSTSCASNAYQYPSVTNTCDGIWSNSIRVRRPLVLGLASSAASMTLVGTANTSGFKFRLADGANPGVGGVGGVGVPTGSSVAAIVGAPSGTACVVSFVSPATVVNSAYPAEHQVTLNADASCSGARIDVTVTTPAGSGTVKSFTIP